MTLEGAWSRAGEQLPSLSSLDVGRSYITLTGLLEPRHPSQCPFHDLQAQRSVPLPGAQAALQLLCQSNSNIPTSSNDTRSQSQIVRETLAHWYLAKCEANFAPLCPSYLAPLQGSVDPDAASSCVPQVFDHLVQWMATWASPLLPGGLLESSDVAKMFTRQFHMQLRLAIDAEVVEAIRAFLAETMPRHDDAATQGVVDRLAKNAEALGLSATVLTLLTSVLHSEVSRKVLASVAGQDAAETDETWNLEEPARDRLTAWLNGEVKPHYHSILHLRDHTTAAHSEALTGMDVIDEADRIVEEEFLDAGAWESRLDFHLDRVLCSVRASQLFDLIAIYPDSIPALEDLRAALGSTDEKLIVARSLSESLQSRLLHPGAHTRDIIEIYVHMVRALREVDPSGVVLSRVVSPLRRYLRARKDTIPVIVSSLLGDDPNFTLLKDELEAADQESADEGDARVTKRRRRRRSMPKGRHKRKAASGRPAGYSSTSSDSDSDYQDPDWHPKPVDAGRGYRLSTSKDIIGMLISIFDDRAGFISALEKSMAEQLVRIRGYKAMREYRNNMILKKRFGEKNMGKCDVMLGDVTESRRLDAGVHSRVERERRNYANTTKEQRDQERGMNEVLDALHPLVISRQFWPDLSPAAAGAGAGAGTAAAAAASTSLLGSSKPQSGSTTTAPTQPSGAMTKLPARFAQATERYQTLFRSSKAMRRLEWLLHLGTVEIELGMEDGRKLAVECSVLEACVVEVVGEVCKAPLTDGETRKVITVDAVVEELGLEQREDAVRALRFWSRQGVLEELEDLPGSFEVVEHLAEDEDEGPDHDDDQAAKGQEDMEGVEVGSEAKELEEDQL